MVVEVELKVRQFGFRDYGFNYLFILIFLDKYSFGFFEIYILIGQSFLWNKWIEEQIYIESENVEGLQVWKIQLMMVVFSNRYRKNKNNSNNKRANIYLIFICCIFWEYYVYILI